MVFENHKCFMVGIPKNGTHTAFGILKNLEMQKNMQTVIAQSANTGRMESSFLTRNGRPYDLHGHGHITYRQWEVIRNNRLNYRDFFTFSIIRNPYDRMVSIWRHSCRNSTSSWRFKQFEQFVDDFYKGLPTEKGPWSGLRKNTEEKHNFGTQSEFLINSSGSIELDYLIRMENIEEDWNSFRKIIPSWPLFPEGYKINNKPAMDYREFYNSETIERWVYTMFQEDFEKLGYKRYEL
jgi:hypothetical protein